MVALSLTVFRVLAEGGFVRTDRLKIVTFLVFCLGVGRWLTSLVNTATFFGFEGVSTTLGLGWSLPVVFLFSLVGVWKEGNGVSRRRRARENSIFTQEQYPGKELENVSKIYALGVEWSGVVVRDKKAPSSLFQ